MSGDVKVQPADLRAKAAEINAPWPMTPVNPNPPCALDLASVAVEQLYASATRMEAYVKAGQSEAVRLSESLNAAAEA
jgi:hypothetical protein